MEEEDSDEDEEGDEVEEQSSAQFLGHQKPVFVVATHPIDPNLAVSGGEDDMGYLWRVDSGEKVAALSGHKDSVISAAFSFDGKMVATGGMDGRVRIWSAVDPAYSTWTFQTSLEGPDEVTWLEWHPSGPVLLAGGNDGTIWMWKLPSGQVMHVLSGHNSSVACGKWTQDGKRFLSASVDSTLILWDPKTGNPVHRLTGNDSRFNLESGINCLAINAAGTVAICGGAEGGLRAVNLVNGVVINAIAGHEEGSSVESIQFAEASGLTFFVTVGTDGKINVFEANTYKLRWSERHSEAISGLSVHSPSLRLATSSADRSLAVWDLRSGRRINTLMGNADVVHDCAWSSDGSALVSAGEDGICRSFPLPVTTV